MLGDHSADCILNQYAIMFQGCAGGAIQFNLGFLVGGHRAYEIEFGQCEVTLCRKRLIAGAGAELLFLLCDIKSTLCQIARFAKLTIGANLDGQSNQRIKARRL